MRVARHSEHRADSFPFGRYPRSAFRGGSAFHRSSPPRVATCGTVHEAEDTVVGSLNISYRISHREKKFAPSRRTEKCKFGVQDTGPSSLRIRLSDSWHTHAV